MEYIEDKERILLFKTTQPMCDKLWSHTCILHKSQELPLGLIHEKFLHFLCSCLYTKLHERWWFHKKITQGMEGRFKATLWSSASRQCFQNVLYCIVIQETVSDKYIEEQLSMRCCFVQSNQTNLAISYFFASVICCSWAMKFYILAKISIEL